MKAAHEVMQSCLLGMAGSRDQNAIFIRIPVSLFCPCWVMVRAWIEGDGEIEELML